MLVYFAVTVSQIMYSRPREITPPCIWNIERPRQIECQLAYHISEWICVNEDVLISVKMKFKDVHKAQKGKYWLRYWFCTQQATSHNLSQWCHSVFSRICVNRHRWVKTKLRSVFSKSSHDSVMDQTWILTYVSQLVMSVFVDEQSAKSSFHEANMQISTEPTIWSTPLCNRRFIAGLQAASKVLWYFVTKCNVFESNSRNFICWTPYE